MNNPTYEQARSLLMRWGYKSVSWNIKPDGSVLGNHAHNLDSRYPGCIWSKTNEELFLPPCDVPDFFRRVEDLIEALAALHLFNPVDVKRLMLAEPGQIRNLGTIEVTAQEIDTDENGEGYPLLLLLEDGDR